MQAETLGYLLSKPEPQIVQLIGSGVLLEQTKGVLYGVFKGGKSTLLANIGMSCSAGLPLFGDSRTFHTKKCRVLHVQLEIPEKAFKRRLRGSSLSQLPDVQSNFYTSTEFWLKLDQDEGVDTISRLIADVKPDLLIIDPLYKVLSGSENSVEDLTRLFDNLDRLMAKFGFALLFSAQGRKTQIVPKMGKIDMGDEELRGNTAMAGWVDTIIGIRRGHDTKRHLNFTLRNGDRESLNITVDYNVNTGLYNTV